MYLKLWSLETVELPSFLGRLGGGGWVRVPAGVRVTVWLELGVFGDGMGGRGEFVCGPFPRGVGVKRKTDSVGGLLGGRVIIGSGDPVEALWSSLSLRAFPGSWPLLLAADIVTSVLPGLLLWVTGVSSGVIGWK